MFHVLHLSHLSFFHLDCTSPFQSLLLLLFVLIICHYSRPYCSLLFSLSLLLVLFSLVVFFSFSLPTKYVVYKFLLITAVFNFLSLSHFLSLFVSWSLSLSLSLLLPATHRLFVSEQTAADCRLDRACGCLTLHTKLRAMNNVCMYKHTWIYYLHTHTFAHMSYTHLYMRTDFSMQH